MAVVGDWWSGALVTAHRSVNTCRGIPRSRGRKLLSSLRSRAITTFSNGQRSSVRANSVVNDSRRDGVVYQVATAVDVPRNVLKTLRGTRSPTCAARLDCTRREKWRRTTDDAPRRFLLLTASISLASLAFARQPYAHTIGRRPVTWPPNMADANGWRARLRRLRYARSTVLSLVCVRATASSVCACVRVHPTRTSTCGRDRACVRVCMCVCVCGGARASVCPPIVLVCVRALYSRTRCLLQLHSPCKRAVRLLFVRFLNGFLFFFFLSNSRFPSAIIYVECHLRDRRVHRTIIVYASHAASTSATRATTSVDKNLQSSYARCKREPFAPHFCVFTRIYCSDYRPPTLTWYVRMTLRRFMQLLINTLLTFFFFFAFLAALSVPQPMYRCYYFF